MDFQIVVTVQASKATDQLSSRDQGVLHDSLSPPPARPVQLTPPDDEEERSVAPEPKPSSIEDLQSGYLGLLARSGEAIETLKRRSGGLVMKIDPLSQPDLYAAANELFDSTKTVTEITYDMYLELLRFEKDLGLQLGSDL